MFVIFGILKIFNGLGSYWLRLHSIIFSYKIGASVNNESIANYEEEFTVLANVEPEHFVGELNVNEQSRSGFVFYVGDTFFDSSRGCGIFWRGIRMKLHRNQPFVQTGKML